MPITIDGTGTITGATTLASTVASPTFTTPALGTPASGILTSCTGVPFDGFKNRIINGAMVIDQRNAGASVTPTNGQYTLDRWVYSLAQTSKLTTQQSTTAPTGFASSLLVTSSSTYAVLTGDNFNVLQWIEGYNTADLAWGTASAATVTLSFWVRSSLTGTFGGSIVNNNQNYSYPFSYTISVANTFEYKTITIAGPTAGTWSNTTTTRNIGVWIGLGAGASASGTAGAWAAAGYYNATGATSVVGTNGATFYITGVQLEKGSTASSFDYRSIGTELALCQRYYQILQNASGGRAETTTFLNMPFRTICTMRAAPSGSIVGTIVVRDLPGTTTRTATTPGSLGVPIVNDIGGYLEFNASSWSPANFTIGNLCALACSTGVNGIALSAEL